MNSENMTAECLSDTTAFQKHKNIPIFIPHMGCPHRCVFCDQKAISGHTTFRFDAVEQEIETALSTIPAGTDVEIAYFGGSFTAIDRGTMVRLLDMAQRYVTAGKVAGIRFSTRPDAVGEDVLDILSRYTIRAIELGLQSMDDTVLTLTRRGHTASQARDACRRIVRRGYSLVGQMMLGLPASSLATEISTAKEICALGAMGARIYPTVVFDGTPLADRMRDGSYIPLSNEEAVERCAEVMKVFEANHVKVLRIGLCASEVLRSTAVLGGADHPALGELVQNALFRERMLAALDGARGVSEVTLAVPVGRTSAAIGQKKSNVRYLCRTLQIGKIIIREDPSLHDTAVSLTDIVK